MTPDPLAAEYVEHVLEDACARVERREYRRALWKRWGEEAVGVSIACLVAGFWSVVAVWVASAILN